jgi:hypothetical protein
MKVWKSRPADHVEAWLEDHGFAMQPKCGLPGYFVTAHRDETSNHVVEGMVRVRYRGSDIPYCNGFGFITKQLVKVAKALGEQGIAVELSPYGCGYPFLIVPVSDALWKAPSALPAEQEAPQGTAWC